MVVLRKQVCDPSSLELVDWPYHLLVAEIGIVDLFIRELPTMTDMTNLGSKLAILKHLDTGVFTTNERRSGKDNATMIAVHLTKQASELINNGDLLLTKFDPPAKKMYRLCTGCAAQYNWH